MNEISIINTKAIDITKPEQFAQFVQQAKALQNVLEEAWGTVEQQMLDHNVNKLDGKWGSITITHPELLTITDARLLDTAMTKPALDTKKVHGYVEVFGELPAGVGTRTIKKFTKRIKG